MDDIRVGKIFRAVRLRLGWRQRDVSAKAGVSQQEVSEIERGELERVALGRIRQVARVLEISLPFSPRWRGPDLDRLLDADHAVLVELVVGSLRRAGWEVLVECSFAHFGERGSVDVVAWHAGRMALLIVEVKSRIVDLQDLLATHDRKVRLAPRLLAAERNWQPVSIGRILVVTRSSTNHAAVARHASVFDAVLPARAWAVRRWLADPIGSLAGISFVRPTSVGSTTNGRRRARGPNHPSRVTNAA